jgi:hypothetical protein
MSILIDTLLDRVKKEFDEHKAIQWENIKPSRKDMNFLRRECNKDSEFDQTNKRKKMFDGLENGNSTIITLKCKYGQIMAVFDTLEQMAELPWDLWGRILRMFSNTDTHKPFKIFFLANTSLRLFPASKEPIQPENINGGYTYRCNPETIVIYRAEDATRVLIHELQHSCCLDNVDHGLDLVEAETEAWAELFYIAILSQGHARIFNNLLQKQSEWIIKQNIKVKKHMKNPLSTEFPWRYTVGKEEIWSSWNILKKTTVSEDIVGNSLRLTHPPNNMLKDIFKVIKESTIL